MSRVPTWRRIVATSAAAAAASFLGAANAAAETADVYVAVARDDVKPYVIFVFSDSSNAGFSPVGAMAYFPRPGYTPSDGKFKENEACLFTREYQLDVTPYEMQPEPIYGPNSTQKPIDPFALPSYMAREAVKLLLAKGYLASEKEAAPYFNCGGYVWAITLGRDPEEIKNLIMEEAEKMRRGG